MQVFWKPKSQERKKKVQPNRTERKTYVTTAGTGSEIAISKSIVVDLWEVSTNNGCVCQIRVLMYPTETIY